MSQIPCQDYIDKIILLENHSYRMKKYKLINPLDYDGDLDVIKIQKIAKILSQHIGYEKLIFTISFKDFDKTHGTIQEVFSNTAGNVLLDDSEDVLIHISRSLNQYPASILATLSHEISHKYIHFNRLTFSNSYENEVFTDLTSIYLGFGKLMLNGVDVTKKTNYGNVEKTYTKKVGYLNREQLSFIYLVINHSLGEQRLSFYSNLKAEVVKAVKKVEVEHSVFFKNIKYYRSKNLKINSLRYKIAYLQKLVSITNPSNLNEIKEYIKFEFEQLNLTEIDLINFKKEFFTRVLAKPNKSRKTRKDIPEIGINSQEYKRFLIMNRKLVNKDLKNSIKGKNLNIIECPVCKKNLKPKNDTIGIIICPSCTFKFAVDTECKIGRVNFKFALKKSIAKLGQRNFVDNIYEKLKLYWLIN